VLYLGALPVVVILKWLREKQVTLTWVTALSPLLITLPLLPQPDIHGDASYLQTTPENFMNWKHVPNNLTHAVSFLFFAGRIFVCDRHGGREFAVAVGAGAPALLLTLLGWGCGWASCGGSRDRRWFCGCCWCWCWRTIS